MSGKDRNVWPDDLKRALERRVLDDGVTVAQALREAHGGELREERGGGKLPAYAIPSSSARYIVHVERQRRAHALAQMGPVVPQDQQIRDMQAMVLDLLRTEITRLGRAAKSKRPYPNPRWTDITAAARAVKTASEMYPAGKAPTVQTPDSNGTEPSKAETFVQRLAKANPSPTATTQRQEPGAKLPAHVQQEPTTNDAASPVPREARSDGPQAA